MIPWDPAKLHAHFAALPGSEQIASAFAVEGLAFWLTVREPKRVCDIGAGIGTLTAVIAKWSNAEIVAVEDDPWCLVQARLNLRGYWSTHELLRGYWLAHELLFYDKVPSSYMSFDFMILDGPQVRREDWQALEPHGLIFIEGGRRGQRAHLEAELRAMKRPFCRAHYKPADDRSKGYWLYVVEPLLWERALLAGVRLREWGRDLRARLRGVAMGKRRR